MATPTGVVTTTSLAPAVAETPVTAVMEVALLTARLLAATPPMVTLVAPDKLVPVIVSVVPPSVVPEVGLTVSMVGSERSMYSNAAVLVALPLGTTTTISLSPMEPAGVTTTIDVADIT